MQTTGQQLVAFLEANHVDRVLCWPRARLIPLLPDTKARQGLWRWRTVV